MQVATDPSPMPNSFDIGVHRPVYLWGGAGTVRMNRLKFMGAPVDEAVHAEAHTPEGAWRMAEEAASVRRGGGQLRAGQRREGGAVRGAGGGGDGGVSEGVYRRGAGGVAGRWYRAGVGCSLRGTM